MIPEWLETITVVQVVGWLIALGVVMAGLKWIAPILDSLKQFVEDWAGEPDRDGVPGRPGVMAALAELRTRVEAAQTDAAAARFNTEKNHGSSPHDDLIKKLDELANQVTRQGRTLGILSTQILTLVQHQDASAADRDALHAHLAGHDAHVKASLADRRQLNQRLSAIEEIALYDTPQPAKEATT